MRRISQHLMSAALALIFVGSGCGRSSPPPAAAVAKVVYVGSKNSNVYHLPSCRSAVRISASNLISFASKADAAKAGYRACEVCKP